MHINSKRRLSTKAQLTPKHFKSFLVFNNPATCLVTGHGHATDVLQRLQWQENLLHIRNTSGSHFPTTNARPCFCQKRMFFLVVLCKWAESLSYLQCRGARSDRSSYTQRVLLSSWWRPNSLALVGMGFLSVILLGAVGIFCMVQFLY